MTTDRLDLPRRYLDSIAARLREDYESLVDTLAAFLSELTIKQMRRDQDGIVIVAPEYYWDDLSYEQSNRQLAIKRDYEEWFSILRTICGNATDDLDATLKQADDLMRTWIELHDNWSLAPDPIANQELLRKDVQHFLKVLSIINASGPGTLILVPDTNAIIANTEPAQYRTIVGGERFVFLLLPTVLGELDELKNLHRNPEFRSKVAKSITRIKGWRNQGSLRDGITVDHDITVMAVATEPDMQKTLPWLDKDNKDDRVIASVLEVQRSYPTSRLILITGDINLSNKADLSRISTAELQLSVRE